VLPIPSLHNINAALNYFNLKANKLQSSSLRSLEVFIRRSTAAIANQEAGHFCPAFS
jgi:hypothetical protein